MLIHRRSELTFLTIIRRSSQARFSKVLSDFSITTSYIMQSPYPEYSTSATPAATGEQAIEMDKTAYNNGTLDMPDNPDAEMLALSANLFSYIENASSANGGGAAGSASQLDHNNNEQNSNAGASTLRPSSQPSAAGPLRHRRGQQDRQLSINSFASNNSNSDSGGGRPAPESNESNDVKTTTSSEHRTVKVGEHAFTIPLSAPIIPPQLQANVRMTSTGRPSHARKVPDDHVKVCAKHRLDSFFRKLTDFLCCL